MTTRPPIVEKVDNLKTWRSVCVKGAGSEEANGRYTPITKDQFLGKTTTHGMGPNIWRHTKHDWLHVVFGEDCWWIGHYANCTKDLYFAPKPNYESRTSPVGVK